LNAEPKEGAVPREEETMGIKMSERLAENYEDYYEDGDSEWRRLCAVEKADSIISLCRDLPHGSVLEIGAGRARS